MQGLIDSIESPGLRAVAEHWREARGSKRMPRWADLSSAVLAPYFKLLWGYQYDPKTGEFTGGLTGEHIKDWLGTKFSGARLLDIHQPSAFREAQSILTQTVSSPSAYRSSGRLFTVGNHTVNGERIALPLAANGVTADGILGASDYQSPVLSGPITLIHDNLHWYPL
ncbi:MAG TPA: PAS domain-containing protein [Rhizomicrobium sp.]|nr:PAS domain-containing protein [Rhizomicrobium sp.]